MKRNLAHSIVVGLFALLSAFWMVGCDGDPAEDEDSSRSAESAGSILGRCLNAPIPWSVENMNNAKSCKDKCAGFGNPSMTAALLNYPNRFGFELCCCYVPETKCSPTNCAGCCMNGVCKTGVDDKVCGSRGAACMDCHAGNAKCQNHRCMYTPSHFDARVP
jgi:hypothetical protein